MANYHFDLSLISGGTGTASDPWGSWASAPTFTAGDRIRFKRGMVQPIGSGWTQRITIGQSGTSGNFITIEAYANTDGSDNTSLAKPIIKVSHPTSLGSQMFYFGTQSYIRVYDIEFDGSAMAQNVRHNCCEFAGGTNLEFRRCYFHNVKRYRSDTGTATSATSSTLTDSSKSWTVNAYAGQICRIASGTGANQLALSITSNTATQLTLTGTWAITPDATSQYEIMTVDNGNGISGSSPSGLVIEDCTFEYFDDDPLIVSGISTGPICRRNTVSHSALSNVNSGDGIQFDGACTGFIIEDNTVYHEDFYVKQGIIVSGASAGSNGVIRNNTVYRRNLTSSLGGPCIHTDQPGALIIDNETWGGAAGIAILGNGAKVYSNKVHDSLNQGVYLNGTNTGIKVIGNIIENCPNPIYSDTTATASQIIHNTLISTGSGVGATVAGASLIRNNVIKDCSTGVSGGGTSNTVDHNSYYNITTQHSGAITDSGGHITSNPLLEEDFTPGTTSPVIAAGATLTTPYRDVDRALYRVVGPTIGAIESRRRRTLLANPT